MELNDILLWGKWLVEIAAILAIVIKGYKFIRKWDKWVEETSEHSLDNYLSIKRLTIMSHDMPLSERIAAGEKYIGAGGNGEVKHKYEELLNQLPKEKFLR